jgi:TrmH family RNA methyltransferase
MGGLPRAFLREPEHCHRFRYNNYYGRSLSMSQNTNSNLITSPKSQTVRKVQALLSKRKHRLKYGQTIVEGPRMVFDLLDNPKTAHLVRQILVSARDYELRDDYRSRLFGGSDDASSPRHDVLVQLVHPEIFPDCTDTISPQGIVAIVDIPETTSLSRDVANAKDEDEQRDHLLEVSSSAVAPMYLVLDGVSDPGNLGTLLRSSLAVGVAGVILLPDCCDAWNPKAVRSAMGASFLVPILESKSWEEALTVLQSSGGVERVYAATMIEEDDESEHDETAPSASLPYFDIDWTRGPSALVIGSEGNGLSPVVRRDLVARKRSPPTTTGNKNADGCDDVVVGATHIPMGAGIESLNAAVCGSVILFEYARQCQRPP